MLQPLIHHWTLLTTREDYIAAKAVAMKRDKSPSVVGVQMECEDYGAVPHLFYPEDFFAFAKKASRTSTGIIDGM